ncbi:MAG: hypothetical protein K1X94_02175 [Sandaracinaceae bacterium]|nr:hypothetical protein [Sandaracinaceae bacterium]
MTDTNETLTPSPSPLATEPTTEVAEATPETERVVAANEGPREERADDPRVEHTLEAAGHIVEAAVDIGRTWASYGLRVGKLALETHAHTMGKLAGALGELNRAIETRENARREHDEPAPSAS